MKQLLARLVFILLAVCGTFAAPYRCAAQATPDTSLNNIIRDDSERQARSAAQPTTTVQQDSIPAATDTVVTKAGPFQPNPKKAGLYSALVPGMGQLYNRQYWKVPVIYVGIAVAGYFFINNLTNYQNYRAAYVARISNPNAVGALSLDQLNQYQSDYSKYLDLTAMISVIGYALQVVDAITAAHLKNFDVSRDISMKVRPIAMPNGVGLGLVMNFK